MTMNKKSDISGPMPSPRVSLTNPEQVETCCATLHCSEQQLRAAVYSVGGAGSNLKAYFRMRSAELKGQGR
jgi:hypothetical protein